MHCWTAVPYHSGKTRSVKKPERRMTRVLRSQYSSHPRLEGLTIPSVLSLGKIAPSWFAYLGCQPQTLLAPAALT